MNKSVLSVVLMLFSFFLYGQRNETKFQQEIDLAKKLQYKDWKETERILHVVKSRVRNEEELAEFYLQAASIYSNVNHFDIALEYCSNAYTYFYPTYPDKVVKIKSIFAFVYSQLNDTPKAINYYKQILSYYQQKHDRVGELKSLNNLANAYYAIDKLDSSKLYFNQAYGKLNKVNDPLLSLYITANLGKLNAKQNQYGEAEFFLLKAEKIIEQEQIEQENVQLLVYQYLANFYYDKKELNKSEYYLGKVKNLISNQFISFQNRDYLYLISKLQYDKKNYKEAAENYKKYDSIRELLNIEETAVNVERIKLKQDYQAKQYVEQIAQNRRKMYVYLIVFVLLIVILICVFFVIVNRSRINKLTLEKELIKSREKELKATNELQEKKLVYKAMEQSKIEMIFKTILEQIDSLKVKTENSGIVVELMNIVNGIKINTKNNSLEEFEYHFVNIHSSFYEQLIKKHPNLTTYDKRLAAMIKLKLSTKQIASLLSVTPKTIENSRTRLRKKMNLTNTTIDIYNYLEELS
ncbi:tetratricopeptide repeat protein [Empedobacter brevis]|uniref:tetratricopeptide repeat protein n=1 Tax=Empedobacter brevis TaxID=247 RepID=UPI00333F8075